MAEIKTVSEGLAAEVERLKAELEHANEREKDLELTRRAMLYLLEDNTEYSAGLLRSKKDWEATFDSISDLILIHDEEMRIIKCNSAYRARAGRPMNEILGKRYYEVFPALDGPFSMCAEAAKDGLEREEEATDGDSVFKVRFYNIKGPGHNSFLHIMEDITEEKKAAERERILYEFLQDIIKDISVDYRLQKICETAVRLGSRMAWIGAPDEATKEVVPKACAGVDDGYVSSIRVRFDDSQFSAGPAGRAVKENRPQGQRVMDESFAPWREDALKKGFRSVLAIPISENEKVLAVLVLYSDHDEFPDRDVRVFISFASHSSAYLKNALLFKQVKEASEKTKEEMEISKHLLMIAYSTAHTTDIDKLMGHVVESLNRIMNSDSCLAYLWDRERRIFQPSQQWGLAAEQVPLFRISGLDPENARLREIMDGKSPVLEIPGRQGAGSTAVVSGLFPWTVGACPAIIIPLVRKDEWLGALFCLYSAEAGRDAFPSGLTKRDSEVLGGISYQVSTALDDAKLYKESIDKTLDLARKIETIQIMHEIDKSILSTLHPSEILETTVMMIGKIISCDRATVGLVDREKGIFCYEAGFGITLPKGACIPFAETTACEVLRTGRPQFVHDLGEAERLPFEEAVFKEGFLSHLRVPLVVKGEIIGILSVGARRRGSFTSEDLSVMEKIASQIGVALENARLLADLGELFLAIVKTLSEAIDAKSPWTGGHSERVTKYALEIGRGIGFSAEDLKDLELAGLLHDLGKLGTYESILDKPGRLTDEELEMMRKHPQKGADILAHIKQMKRIVPAIKHHHEYYDGTGYPDGLKGEEIPLMARILALADTVDAMSADRPYRKGKPDWAIIAELRRCSGTQFDPRLVEAFLKKEGGRGERRPV